MYRNKRWPGSHVLTAVLVILFSALLTVCVGSVVWSQDINLEPDVTLSFTNDIVGITEQEFDAILPVDVSFSVGSVDIGLNGNLDAVSSQTRLDTLSVLRAEVAALPASALKDALNLSLSQADAAIDTIRNSGSGISIDALYNQMKIIESALDKYFIDLVDDSVDLLPISKARLLVIAKPIEQRYDYLKYITNKIRLYARDKVKAEFAALLRLSVLDLAAGDGAAYCSGLLGIIARASECRGTTIKEEEADRIRYKADLLLRKVAENGVNRACDVDLSTTIAGIDVDGALSWEDANYRAPSKDVHTYGLEVAAGYASDDWDVSIDYQQERRDYTDRLKDNGDRTKHSLDISVSRDLDPRNVDLSASFDDEFYPNDIDQEIEAARVTEVRVGISDLLHRVYELHLTATVENRLVKDLGEDGALGALAIEDRGEAADCLEDFVDHLLDAEWNGDMDRDASQSLIAIARELLPRRRIYDIDIPLSVGFPFGGGDMTADIEWERKTYPADSPLDHETSTGNVSYTRDESALTVSGYLKREELIYPHATKKNRSLREWEGSVENDLSCGDLTLTLFHQLTAYPLARLKDQSVQRLDLDLSIDFADVSAVLQWTNKVTEHLNDAGKPIVQVTEMGFNADWDVAQGTLSASLSDEREWNTDHADTNTIERTLVKETYQAELSWDGKIADDLDLGLSLTWESVIGLVDPSKDSTNIALQIQLDLAL